MRNKLVLSLETLLAQHDCVVVPQFGAFIREQVPASWDREHKIAYPPSVVLRFNEALQHQDGLLLDYYASILGVSQRRAKLELEQDVKHLRQQLLRWQHIDLEGIGALHLSPEGRISFTSRPDTKIAHTFYGLQAVLTPISRSEESQKQDLGRGEQTTDQYYHFAISKRWLRYAGAVAVVLLLVGLPLSIWLPQMETYQASFVPNREVAQPTTEPKEELATEPIVTPEAQPQPEICLPKEEYYVIIGSERKREVAERYMTYYKDKYPEMSILEGKHVYRISAATFAEQGEAQAYVNELSRQGVASWVYKP